MDVGTQSADCIVNVGSAANLYSLYSTATTLLGRNAKETALALELLRSGTCAAKDCAKAAKQLSRVSDVLEEHSPGEAVWDIDHSNIPAPWDGHLAPEIASCADLYTTSEGEPLLTELIALLQYAQSTKQAVVALG